jgi:hypothetical protein
MEGIPNGLTILTTMVTPAVLILASGSLLLTTSQRLNRSIERTRKVSAELKEIRDGNKDVTEAERKMLFGQLSKSAKRAMLLQRSMTFLYLALFFFITDSLMIGIFEIVNAVNSWVMIILSISGVILLFAASISFILETRLAYLAVREEIKFRLTAEE